MRRGIKPAKIARERVELAVGILDRKEVRGGKVDVAAVMLARARRGPHIRIIDVIGRALGMGRALGKVRNDDKERDDTSKEEPGPEAFARLLVGNPLRSAAG